VMANQVKQRDWTMAARTILVMRGGALFAFLTLFSLHAHEVDGQDLPHPIQSYLAAISQFKNASFAYQKFVESPRRPAVLESPASLIEFGSVSLDFEANAYKQEQHLRSGDDFPLHRLKSHAEDLTTEIWDNTNDELPPTAVIGGNRIYHCPFNFLGLGFAISNDLGMDAQKLRHLDHFIIGELHVGPILEASPNVFEIRSIGYKSRFSNPQRVDCVLEFPVDVVDFPNRIELRLRSEADSALDTVVCRYEVERFSELGNLRFPVRIKRTTGVAPDQVVNLMVIDPSTLVVNDPSWNKDISIDLKGLSGYDHRTRSRFGEPEVPPVANAGSETKSPDRAVAEKLSDTAGVARLSASVGRTNWIWKVSIGAGLAGILMVLWWYQRSQAILPTVLAIVGMASMGCSPNTSEQSASGSGSNHAPLPDDSILVSTSDMHDADWYVEGPFIIRGTVGNEGNGLLVIVTKPYADAPEISILSEGSEVSLGTPLLRKNDVRRWEIPATLRIQERGSFARGPLQISAGPGHFPPSYEVEVIAEGRSPGQWSKKILINPPAQGTELFFDVDEGWQLQEFGADDPGVVLHSTSTVDTPNRHTVGVSFSESELHQCTLEAVLTNDESVQRVPLKVIFPSRGRK
jgi:hypothetical protein